MHTRFVSCVHDDDVVCMRNANVMMHRMGIDLSSQYDVMRGGTGFISKNSNNSTIS